MGKIKIPGVKRTVGNVKIEISGERLEKNLREAQIKLNQMVIQDSTPYIPFRTGVLRGSYRYPEGIDGSSVEWDTPYAHYQYQGELYLASNGSSWARKGEEKYPSGRPLTFQQPGTGKLWFEQAKKQNLSKWEKEVEKTAKGK